MQNNDWEIIPNSSIKPKKATVIDQGSKADNPIEHPSIDKQLIPRKYWIVGGVLSGVILAIIIIKNKPI